METNDHPHGSIAVSPLSSEVSVAEDFPTGDGNDDVVSQAVSNNVTIMVDRKMGTDGVIKVLIILYASPLVTPFCRFYSACNFFLLDTHSSIG